MSNFQIEGLKPVQADTPAVEPFCVLTERQRQISQFAVALIWVAATVTCAYFMSYGVESRFFCGSVYFWAASSTLCAALYGFCEHYVEKRQEQVQEPDITSAPLPKSTPVESSAKFIPSAYQLAKASLNKLQSKPDGNKVEVKALMAQVIDRLDGDCYMYLISHPQTFEEFVQENPQHYEKLKAKFIEVLIDSETNSKIGQLEDIDHRLYPLDFIAKFLAERVDENDPESARALYSVLAKLPPQKQKDLFQILRKNNQLVKVFVVLLNELQGDDDLLDDNPILVNLKHFQAELIEANGLVHKVKELASSIVAEINANEHKKPEFGAKIYAKLDPLYTQNLIDLFEDIHAQGKLVEFFQVLFQEVPRHNGWDEPKYVNSMKLFGAEYAQGFGLAWQQMIAIHNTQTKEINIKVFSNKLLYLYFTKILEKKQIDDKLKAACFQATAGLTGMPSFEDVMTTKSSQTQSK